MRKSLRLKFLIFGFIMLILNTTLILILKSNDLHFYSYFVETIPYNLSLFFFFFTLLFVFLNNRIIWILLIVFWSVLQVFTSLISSVVSSGNDNIELYTFKNLEKPLITYMYSPHGIIHFINGETYFYDILYSEVSMETHDASSVNMGCNLENYIIPETMKNSECIAVWESEGLLLDFTNMIAEKAILKNTK